MNKFDKRLSYLDNEIVMRASERAAQEFTERIYDKKRHDIGYSSGDEPPSSVDQLTEMAKRTYGPERAMQYARLCASFCVESCMSYTKIHVPNDREILKRCIESWEDVAEHAWLKAEGRQKMTWNATAESATKMIETLYAFLDSEYVN